MKYSWSTVFYTLSRKLKSNSEFQVIESKMFGSVSFEILDTNETFLKAYHVYLDIKQNEVFFKS